MKIIIKTLVLFIISLTPLLSYAQGNQYIFQVRQAHLTQVPIQVAYSGQTISITNKSFKAFSLKKAMISFVAAKRVPSISTTQQSWQLLSSEGKPVNSQQPNNEGILYIFKASSDKTVVLKPHQTMHVQVGAAANNIHGVQLYAEPLVPVQATVTATISSSLEISICNTSPYDIPLNQGLELDFNYPGTISSVWGSPWLDWQVTQDGNSTVLSSDYPTVSPAVYAPDPGCKTPITIDFTPTANNTLPTDFVFKVVGGTPIGSGNLTITMPPAPYEGAAAPTVTVTGSDGFQQQQTVGWRKLWKLSNILPSTYVVTSQRVSNGTDYYKAKPQTAKVINDQTVRTSIGYQAMRTGTLSVTLQNAPDSSEPVKVSSIHAGSYTFNVSSGQSITVPVGKYNVTSMVSGYNATITPNPVAVSNSKNAAVNINYQIAPDGRIVGYFETWSDSWASSGEQTQLASLPSYVNYVLLAFMQPDAQYQAGSYDLTNTGIQTSYSGEILKQAIDDLHQKNPNTKILVAVGGATYTNWVDLNATAVANFVKDFDLDGVDIDYEPNDPGCTTAENGLISCQIDQTYQQAVEAIRTDLPRPYVLTVAAFSVGAYGEDQWKSAQPVSSHTGQTLPLLRSSAAQDIDMINLMSYDAGTTYVPEQALAAYQNYFPTGVVAAGVEVPPEAWGGHVYTMDDVNHLTQADINNAGQQGTPAAMMIWSLQKQPNGTPSSTNPNAQMMLQSICNDLGLMSCNQPLFL